MTASVSFHTENYPSQIGDMKFSADDPMRANCNSITLTFTSPGCSGSTFGARKSVTVYHLSDATADLLHAIGSMTEEERAVMAAQIQAQKETQEEKAENA